MQRFLDSFVYVNDFQMGFCAVCLSGAGDDPVTTENVMRRIVGMIALPARRAYVCAECGKQITSGQRGAALKAIQT